MCECAYLHLCECLRACVYVCVCTCVCVGRAENELLEAGRQLVHEVS